MNITLYPCFSSLPCFPLVQMKLSALDYHQHIEIVVFFPYFPVDSVSLSPHLHSVLAEP